MSGARTRTAGKFCWQDDIERSARARARVALQREIVEQLDPEPAPPLPWETDEQDRTCYGDSSGPCDCWDCDPPSEAYLQRQYLLAFGAEDES